MRMKREGSVRSAKARRIGQNGGCPVGGMKPKQKARVDDDSKRGRRKRSINSTQSGGGMVQSFFFFF
jgi:hypothetical protein